MSESTMPSEEQMRTQMFKTMVALEKAATSFTDYFDGFGDAPPKAPGVEHSEAVLQEKRTRVSEGGSCDHSRTQIQCKICAKWIATDVTPNPPGVDYSTLLAECGNCSGLVRIVNCERQWNSPEDTCTCNPGIEDLLVPPDVKQFYRRNIDPQGPTGPPADLTEIHKTLEAHRKALAIIGVFGGFENVGFSQMEPGRRVRDLAGLTACRECIGTGWIARDETCSNCKQQGYIKP